MGCPEEQHLCKETRDSPQSLPVTRAFLPRPFLICPALALGPLRAKKAFPPAESQRPASLGSPATTLPPGP